MIDHFYVFGVASLQLIPIFTFTYLQNEIGFLKKIFDYIPSKFLSVLSMFISFALIFVNTLSIEPTIKMINSVLLIMTLSMSINSTYQDYTVDEGYYITIPYLSIYSCLVFFISTNEYSLYTLESYRLSTMLFCSLICYILYSSSVYFRIGFRTNYLNYIAFIGIILSTVNMIFLINQIQMVDCLLVQFIHLYLYFAHLLSVKFEVNPSSATNLFNQN